MVVISPLNWLIKDQITSCERIGIKACKVEVENSTSLLEVRDYDILFASPEVFENPLVAKRLTRYCDRIIGIVIDESSKGGHPGLDQSESRIEVTWYKWTNQRAAEGHVTCQSSLVI